MGVDSSLGVVVADPDAGAVLDPTATYELLTTHGIRMPGQIVVSDVESAIEAARALDDAVALKAIVPGVIHRTDMGAVAKNLPTPEAVGIEAKRMMSDIAGVHGFMVQRWVEGQIELFVGMRRDPLLGPFLLVGLGGLWVELIDDVAVWPLPVDASRALRMLEETKASELLSGFRGQPRIDPGPITQSIVAVSKLATENPTIQQLDLNPLLVGPDGAQVVDAQVIAGSGIQPGSPTRQARDLTPLLEPRDIVVIGASTDTGKPGGRIVSYLKNHEFPGPVYPVNLRGADVLGIPSHRSVLDLPSTPDLACVLVPATEVTQTLEQCIAKGIPAAIVYSSGVDGDSGEHNSPLADVVARSEILISGPNTAGLVNTRHQLYATISMAFDIEEVPGGRIGFITQSGALGSSLISRIWDEGVGFSHWISSGNEADVTLSEYLRFLVDDPETDAIAVFLESIRDRDGFAEAARLAREKQKPIIAYKTGVSERGQQAVQSHTSALAGDDRLYEAFLRSCGVVRVKELQTLLDASVALAWQPIPRGNRVAVVTASGGVSSVTADESTLNGLNLHPFSPATRQKIASLIPTYGRSENPVDVTMGITQRPTMIPDVASVLMEDQEFDAVLVVLTTNAGDAALEVARGLSELGGHREKPLLVARVSSENLAPEAMAHYRDNRIPVFSMPERAVRALGVMTRISSEHGE